MPFPDRSRSPIDPAAPRGTPAVRYHHHEHRSVDHSRSPRPSAPTAPTNQRKPFRSRSPVTPCASNEHRRPGRTLSRPRSHPVGSSIARARVSATAFRTLRTAHRPTRARTQGPALADSQPAAPLMLEPSPHGRPRTIPSTGMLRGRPCGCASVLLQEVCNRFRHVGSDIPAESRNLPYERT